MKFVYTKHAEDKLKENEAKLFRISKKKLENIIQKPHGLRDLKDVTRAIGTLDMEHSPCVIYRFEQHAIKIITFFPAKKGRYEN